MYFEISKWKSNPVLRAREYSVNIQSVASYFGPGFICFDSFLHIYKILYLDSKTKLSLSAMLHPHHFPELAVIRCFVSVLLAIMMTHMFPMKSFESDSSFMVKKKEFSCAARERKWFCRTVLSFDYLELEFPDKSLERKLDKNFPEFSE